jgi:co-chaperonin GroES (HSP10)
MVVKETKDYSEVIKLISGKILVREESTDLVSESGLEIGKSGVVQKSIGSVIMSSSEKYVKSDRVAYAKFGGVEVEISGKMFKVLQEDEMFFKIKENGEFEACNNWVIVSRNIKVKESEGGLLIAQSSQKERTSGVVISKSKDIDAEFGTGTEVVFSRHAGFDAEILEKHYVILNIDEIFMYITQIPK